MALQYLLERITLTRTDKARYQSFREKHEHYINDALDKLNDTARHRLLQHVRSSVQQQGGGRRQLRNAEVAARQQQVQLLDVEHLPSRVQRLASSSIGDLQQQQQQRQQRVKQQQSDAGSKSHSAGQQVHSKLVGSAATRSVVGVGSSFGQQIQQQHQQPPPLILRQSQHQQQR
jgi:hypothetical protein